MKISAIEGIGPAMAGKLAAAGVKTVESLLKQAATKKGREELAKASGIDTGKLLDWVNMADLFRLKGVASQNAELLKAAGVDTVVELGKRKANNLHAKMLEVNTAKNHVRRPPTLKQVEGWIAQAKALPRVVTH